MPFGFQRYRSNFSFSGFFPFGLFLSHFSIVWNRWYEIAAHCEFESYRSCLRNCRTGLKRTNGNKMFPKYFVFTVCWILIGNYFGPPRQFHLSMAEIITDYSIIWTDLVCVGHWPYCRGDCMQTCLFLWFSFLDQGPFYRVHFLQLRFCLIATGLIVVADGFSWLTANICILFLW